MLSTQNALQVRHIEKLLFPVPSADREALECGDGVPEARCRNSVVTQRSWEPTAPR